MGTRFEHWLKSMPPVPPPDGLYEGVRAAQRQAARAHRTRVKRRYGAGLALAAGLATAAVLVLYTPPDATVADDDLQVLRAQAVALEDVLGRFDHESRVLDIRTAHTIVQLEDSIAAVDWNLRAVDLDAGGRARLWEQRIGLMEALVGVHVAHAADIEF